jgi:hypothetical protein
VSLAVFEAPAEKLRCLFVGFPRSILAQNLSSGAKNWPTLGTRLIRENYVEILGVRKVRVRSGGLQSVEAETDQLASTVVHARVA